MNPILANTPVEVREIGWRRIAVKREDLCSPYPGPSFSKIRGVMAHIAARPEQTIGVLDTFHSKAGWAVAYCCAVLGKRCVNYYPRYKSDGEALRRQQAEAEKLGASLVALPAGRSAILYHTARKRLAADEGDAYLMPNALKLPESVSETAAETWRTLDLAWHLNPDGRSWIKNVVLSVSSGTIAAGVMRGFATHARYLRGGEPLPTFILHAGYSRSSDALYEYLRGAGGPEIRPALANSVLFDEGYAYKDAFRPRIDAQVAPFPCNPYYDAKAWGWLTNPKLPASMLNDVLFWNVGD